jgi:hypothetical protein
LGISLLLLILCSFPLVVMSTPGIPASWEQCPPDQNICKNGGQCFFDGLAEFCMFVSFEFTKFPIIF